MNRPPVAPFVAVFLIALLAAGALVPGCVGPRRVSDRDIRVVSIGQLASLMDAQNKEPDEKKLLLIDSRSREKYEAGHIPGARHMQLNAIDPNMKRDEWIDSFDEIVVYADDPGSASPRALVKRMLRMRYDDVRLFPGGYKQWTKSELPVETVETGETGG